MITGLRSPEDPWNHTGAMHLQREHLLRVTTEIRTLFATLDLDVSPYSDANLIDAVLAVAPLVDDGWLSDEQVRQVFQHVAGTSSK